MARQAFRDLRSSSTTVAGWVCVMILVVFQIACGTTAERGQIISLSGEKAIWFTKNNSDEYLDCSKDCISTIKNTIEWRTSNGLIIEKNLWT